MLYYEDMGSKHRGVAMSKESRDAIVSVRISENDQVRLRELAVERGTSVSELIRSVVMREVSEPSTNTVTATAGTQTPRGSAGATTASAAPTHGADKGIFWVDQEPGQAVISGETITLLA